MAAEPFTPVGRIVKSHGLKGEVSVAFSSDASLDSLVGLEAWIVPPPAAIGPTRIASVRPGPKGPIVALDGVDSIDAAKQIAGREILVRSDELPHDWEAPEELEAVVGYAVTDESHGDLGEITDVIVTGANDVWVVRGPLGEVLVPVIDDVVIGVDEAAGRVSVRLLPGLLPEESERT
jgi:16S rRNA processing protein RimM